MTLAQEQCTTCRSDASPVTGPEAEELLKKVPDWEIRTFEGVDHLVRTYKFKDFANALRFTVNVGEMADEEGHHPTLITVWGKEDALPGPQGQTAVNQGDRNAHGGQGRLDMGGHVVRPLGGVGIEAVVFRDQTVKPVFQVVPDRGIAVFLNQQTGGCVLNIEGA